MKMAALRVLLGLQKFRGLFKIPLPCATVRLKRSVPKISFINTSQHCRFFHKTSCTLGQIVSFKLSDIGEGISEVTVKEWFVKIGDKVNQFDSICEVQSDKASVTITSRYDGYVRKIYYDVEDTAKVGLPLVDIELYEDDSSSSDEQVDQLQDQYAAPTKELSGSSEIFGGKVLATPAVRRLAGEHDINLDDVPGTGKDGRILKEDIFNFINTQKESKKDAQIGGEKVIESFSTQKSIPAPVPKGEDLTNRKSHAVLPIRGEDRIEAIKGYQKAMAKMMSKTCSVPCFLYCDDVDVTQLVMLRKIMKKRIEERGIKFSYMPIFIKATSLALLHYPELNASVDEKCENMIYKADHNIGIAMDTSQGLIVPNIKKVQQLTLLEVAAELSRLQELGTKGQLGTNDLSKGTFTLSNIGAIGGTYAKPVLLLPEVAIGAIGKIKSVPQFDENDDVVKKDIMQVSWTADHRVIDGATVSRFSNLWKSFLENPVTMLLYMK